MSLGIDEIEEVIAAAVAAEAWFTHQECTNVDSLDYNAFQIADKLRVALGHIEQEQPHMIVDAQQTVGNEFPLFT
jgi:hypothetical protein